MKLHTLQDDFSAGEVSPRLRGKVRSKQYNSGLSYCENWEVTPQGSLRTRNGTKFQALINAENAAVYTFPRPDGDDYAVVVTRDFVTVYDKNGVVISNEQNYFSDPTFDLGLVLWNPISFINESPVGSGTSSPLPTAISDVGVEESFIYEKVGGPVTGGSVGSNISQWVDIQDSNLEHTIKYRVTFLDTAAPVDHRGCEIGIFVKDDTGALIYLQPDTLYTDYPLGQNEQPIPDVGDFIDFELKFTPPNPTSRLQVTFGCAISRTKVPNSTGQTTGGSVRYSDFVLQDENAASGASVQFPSPYNDSNLTTIHTAEDSAEGKMFMTCKEVEMHQLTFVEASGTWNFAPFVPNAPAAEFDSPPTTCAIHQGRLWLGGSPAKKATLWASQSGVYEEFIVGTDPDSPLKFELTTAGAIRWLKGVKELLIGTDLGCVVGRSLGAIITPSDFGFSRDQTWASSNAQPALVGSQTMFTSSDRSKLRSFFDGGLYKNGYESDEPSWISDHLTRGKVLSIDYAQDPKYLLYCLLATGSMSVSTYRQDGEFNAWHRFTTDGTVLSVSSTDDSTGSSLWMVVSRPTPDGDPRLTLERKSGDSSIDYQLDSYVATTPDSNAVVFGLDHLDDKDCKVVVYINGKPTLHSDVTPSGGSATLDDWTKGYTVVIGLPYSRVFKTLPKEGMSLAGTSQVAKRRHNKIYCRIYNSAIPIINGQRPKPRNPQTNMGQSPAPVESGDTKTTDLGWDDGTIEIIQDVAIPTEVVGIFTKSAGNSV